MSTSLSKRNETDLIGIHYNLLNKPVYNTLKQSSNKKSLRSAENIVVLKLY